MEPLDRAWIMAGFGSLYLYVADTPSHLSQVIATAVGAVLVLLALVVVVRTIKDGR